MFAAPSTVPRQRIQRTDGATGEAAHDVRVAQAKDKAGRAIKTSQELCYHSAAYRHISVQPLAAEDIAIPVDLAQQTHYATVYGWMAPAASQCSR